MPVGITSLNDTASHPVCEEEATEAPRYWVREGTERKGLTCLVSNSRAKRQIANCQWVQVNNPPLPQLRPPPPATKYCHWSRHLTHKYWVLLTVRWCRRHLTFTLNAMRHCCSSPRAWWIKPGASSTGPCSTSPGSRWVHTLTIYASYRTFIPLSLSPLSAAVANTAFGNVAINICALNPGFLPGWSAAVSPANAGVCGLDDRERAPTAAAARRTGYTAGVVKWTRLALCKCDVMAFLFVFLFIADNSVSVVINLFQLRFFFLFWFVLLILFSDLVMRKAQICYFWAGLAEFLEVLLWNTDSTQSCIITSIRRYDYDDIEDFFFALECNTFDPADDQCQLNSWQFIFAPQNVCSPPSNLWSAVCQTMCSISTWWRRDSSQDERKGWVKHYTWFVWGQAGCRTPRGTFASFLKKKI